MTATWRVGHGGAAGAKAMGQYLTTEMLTPEPGSRAAYYLGDVPARSWSFIDHLGQQIHAGEIAYGDALDMLVLAELRGGSVDDITDVEKRISDRLVGAAEQADIEEFYGKPPDQVGAIARVRPDLSPAVAQRLGITDLPLTQEALTHLLSGRRADGGEIEGKTRRSAGRSVAEVFGLPAKGKGCKPPDEPAIRNILDGKRADGSQPRMKGEALPDAVVAGARKRFLDIYEAAKNRALTDTEIANMARGEMARGTARLTAHRWQSQVNAKRERVTFLDLTLSADKSMSVAWALAPTEAERAIIQTAHRDAVVATMAYLPGAGDRPRQARRWRKGWNRAGEDRLVQLRPLHQPAHHRLRADRQGREDLHRLRHRAASRRGYAVAHAFDRAEHGADPKRSCRIDGPRPAERHHQTPGGDLPRALCPEPSRARHRRGAR